MVFIQIKAKMIHRDTILYSLHGNLRMCMKKNRVRE